jgi:hypothetical protein
LLRARPPADRNWRVSRKRVQLFHRARTFCNVSISSKQGDPHPAVLRCRDRAHRLDRLRLPANRFIAVLFVQGNR